MLVSATKSLFPPELDKCWSKQYLTSVVQDWRAMLEWTWTPVVGRLINAEVEIVA